MSIGFFDLGYCIKKFSLNAELGESEIGGEYYCTINKEGDKIREVFYEDYARKTEKVFYRGPGEISIDRFRELKLNWLNLPEIDCQYYQNGNCINDSSVGFCIKNDHENLFCNKLIKVRNIKGGHKERFIHDQEGFNNFLREMEKIKQKKEDV